ncbi:NUDIX hydrolase [Paraoerskovia sediminicola]|uniref:NUDIX hydrolase n=1 Tax=Paraoerskovia sediminicola TaxID=1138587 RepID=A0ABM8G6K1_9CELL|nr:NUDIX hydrolase [Paraoerskovia sediminicola]BDZ43764.1 NUDIX hydrolase [Paraoerskovia sediminicola]
MSPDGAREAVEVRDRVAPRPVAGRRLIHRGRIWDLVSDDVVLSEDVTVTRELLDHPGAVAVVVLDDEGRVLLQRQYRHPVGRELWEIPAGLLDVEGEPAIDTARRELAEEADLRAERWDVLVDLYTTPGGSTEALRVFLARDLSPVPVDERFEREHEEADMEAAWVPLAEAADAVLAGHLHNPSTVAGVLAAARYADRDFVGLRPTGAPWPERRGASMIDGGPPVGHG